MIICNKIISAVANSLNVLKFALSSDSSDSDSVVYATSTLLQILNSD